MRFATSARIHQSGFASPGSGRKARWREMRRSEFVTVPSFSPQAAAGNSTCAPRAIVSVAITFSETTRRSSWRSASRAPSASGSDTAGFVAMKRLDAAGRNRLEQRHRLEPLALGHPWRAPEAAHPIDLLGGETHVSREHVGEAADLAPAHRVRLTGERERPRARPPDPPGRKVAADDRVDLLGALRRLVHALREAGDGSLRRGEQFKKGLNGGHRKAR